MSEERSYQRARRGLAAIIPLVMCRHTGGLSPAHSPLCGAGRDAEQQQL